MVHILLILNCFIKFYNHLYSTKRMRKHSDSGLYKEFGCTWYIAVCKSEDEWMPCVRSIQTSKPWLNALIFFVSESKWLAEGGGLEVLLYTWNAKKAESQLLSSSFTHPEPFLSIVPHLVYILIKNKMSMWNEIYLFIRSMTTK